MTTDTSPAVIFANGLELANAIVEEKTRQINESATIDPFFKKLFADKTNGVLR